MTTRLHFRGMAMRRRRVELGLTLTAAAARMRARGTRCSKEYLSQVERGVFEPSPERARALAEMLGLPVLELWAEEPAPTEATR